MFLPVACMANLNPDERRDHTSKAAIIVVYTSSLDCQTQVGTYDKVASTSVSQYSEARVIICRSVKSAITSLIVHAVQCAYYLLLWYRVLLQMLKQTLFSSITGIQWHVYPMLSCTIAKMHNMCNRPKSHVEPILPVLQRSNQYCNQSAGFNSYHRMFSVQNTDMSGALDL